MAAGLGTGVVGIGAKGDIRIPIRSRRRIGGPGVIVVSRIVVDVPVSRVIVVRWIS